jgi:cardiolipin synthase
VNLPNIISLARLISVPVVIWLIAMGHLAAAFWLFVAAGLSDAVDGAIAKGWGLTSELGGYLDPIADKALIGAVFVALGWRGEVPAWLAILVVSRDLMLVGGIMLMVALGQTVTIAPILISKVNTAGQIALAAVVLGEHGLGADLDAAQAILIPAVATTTILSGALYVVGWARRQPKAGVSP